MISIKPGVNIANLVDEMDAAQKIVDQCYGTFGYDCWITSGNDGLHHGKPIGHDPSDPHYMGKALDFRVRNVPTIFRPRLFETIATRLAALSPEYVVLWDNKGTDEECFHVQYGHVLA